MPIWYLILALVFGSFTNVLIYRIPRAKSIFQPGSYCPECNTQLRFWDKIPVLSYILLACKCFKCKSRIPLKYPLIELLVAALAFPFSLKQPNIFIFSFYLLVISFTVALAFIDLEFQNLPHALTYSGTLISVIFFSFFDNPFYENFFGFKLLASLFQIGVVFYLLDTLVDSINLLVFKNQAARYANPAVTFNLKFLNQHLGKIYLILNLIIIYFFINDDFKILYFIFAALGFSYLSIEIIYSLIRIGIESKYQEQHINESTQSNSKTILGGGDIAMTVFIASVIGFKYAFIVLFVAFNLSFVFFVLQNIFLALKNFKVEKSLNFSFTAEQKIPLGPALALSFLAAMMIFG